MRIFKKSNKLDNVCYDIRGPIMQEAKRLEEEGFFIHKLNIGNPAPFGLFAPEEVLHDVIVNIRDAQGYTDSKGMFSARKAIMQHAQGIGIPNITLEDIYTGNGVSELIVTCMQGLLNSGDEVLIPAPDYPLWTAAAYLAGGKAVHYLCDEESGWAPDIADLKAKITARTIAIVLINPNNPTGAVYPKEVIEDIIQLAREHSLILFSDEIYDKILYDQAKHYSPASLCDDVLCITMNGLSKTYRAAGFRAGWMIISGKKSHAKDFIDGLNILSSMRLCSNALAQLAIQTSLGGYQSINDLTSPGGRLYEQREYIYNRLTVIPGITCVKPLGALYLFPKMDIKHFHIKSDYQMAMDMLQQEKILIVQGTGFNWKDPDHFRIVFLPPITELATVMEKMTDFFKGYCQAN